MRLTVIVLIFFIIGAYAYPESEGNDLDTSVTFIGEISSVIIKKNRTVHKEYTVDQEHPVVDEHSVVAEQPVAEENTDEKSYSTEEAVLSDPEVQEIHDEAAQSSDNENINSNIDDDQLSEAEEAKVLEIRKNFAELSRSYYRGEHNINDKDDSDEDNKDTGNDHNEDEMETK